MNDAIVVEQDEVSPIQPELDFETAEVEPLDVETAEVEPKLRPVSRGGYVDVMVASLVAY